MNICQRKSWHYLSSYNRWCLPINLHCCAQHLTLKAPIATKVVCFSRLLKCLRILYGKQRGSRSDCSYRSSLFWVHTVCFYTLFVSNVRQLFEADVFSRQHFQMNFFLGALSVNLVTTMKVSFWATMHYCVMSCKQVSTNS